MPRLIPEAELQRQLRARFGFKGDAPAPVLSEELTGVVIVDDLRENRIEELPGSPQRYSYLLGQTPAAALVMTIVMYNRTQADMLGQAEERICRIRRMYLDNQIIAASGSCGVTWGARIGQPPGTFVTGTIFGNAWNRRSSEFPRTQVDLHQGTVAQVGAYATVIFGRAQVRGDETLPIEFPGPGILIPPGQCFIVSHRTVNTDLDVTCEYEEFPIR